LISPGDQLQTGSFEITRLSDGKFYVDGGAMFGVVPRTLWEKKASPDRENRIPLALNCYLIKGPESTILLETGVGPDVGRPFVDFYSYEAGPALFRLLSNAGIKPEDVDIVANSHLHFDHCGGNTLKTAEGRWSPAFPRARYVIQRGEWEQALHPVERDKPSYAPARLKCLNEWGSLQLLDGNTVVREGVEAVLVPGHTAFHQGFKVTSGKNTFFYFGDLVPTAAHIDLAYIMSFDLYPVETFATKKNLYARAVEEGWVVAFGHDVHHAFGSITKTGRGFEFRPLALGPGQG
jgi:glyoxylase-like metal-dependent hydrolase (beta-lactamase superfamily II)